MSDSVSLTSLREEKPKPDPIPQSSNLDINLSEVRADIVQAEKIKSDLLAEIDRLEHQAELTRERLKVDTEVKRLKIQRNILFGQIKELVLAINTLQNKKSEFVSALESFSEERFEGLIDFSYKLSGELSKFSKDLTHKSEELAQEEELLADFALYYVELAQICEAESAQNALQRAEIEEGQSDTAIKEETAKEALKIAQERLSKADSVLKLAEKRFEDTDSLASYFEKEADLERKKLMGWSKELSSKEISIKALNKTKAKLKRKEEELNKEATRLQREAEAIRKGR